MPASSIFNWFSRPNSKSTLDGRGPNSLSEEPEPYNRLTPFEVGSLLTSLAEAQKRKVLGHSDVPLNLQSSSFSRLIFVLTLL